MIPRLVSAPSEAWTRLDIKSISPQMCDEGSAHLITHVETTHAAVPDEQILPQVHEALGKQELLPKIHLVDAGYTTAKGLVDSQNAPATHFNRSCSQPGARSGVAGGNLTDGNGGDQDASIALCCSRGRCGMKSALLLNSATESMYVLGQ